MSFSLEPAVPLSSLAVAPADWEAVDGALGEALGLKALAIPSVRVGLLWTLEHMGLGRHRDEVLVPRYLGRCILDAVGRAAHPVYSPGPATRAAILVHSLGLAPDFDKVLPRLGVPFIEDAPDALSSKEGLAPGSTAKLFALSKFLPVLKGGAMITEDASLADAIRARRKDGAPAWVPWWILAALASHRRGRRCEGSAFVESAYSLYPNSPCDNSVLRGQLLGGVGKIPEFSAVASRRLGEAEKALGGRMLHPSARRLVRAAAFESTSAEEGAVMASLGFDASGFHVDADRNIFSPRWVSARLIPLHPGVPEDVFRRLLKELAKSI
jgi:hypothetical protein